MRCKRIMIWKKADLKDFICSLIIPVAIRKRTMKKLRAIWLSVAVLTIFSPVPAQAEDRNVYISPKIMWTHLQHDSIGLFGSSRELTDNIIGGALAAGYDFHGGYSYPIRLELEVGMHDKVKYSEKPTGQTNAKIGYEIDVATLFANIYFDYHNKTDLTPYIGGGLGMARLKATTKLSGFSPYLAPMLKDDGFGKSETTWNFAWNVGVGVAYTMTESISLDLGYRYADFGSMTIVKGINDKYDITGHEVLLGARFSF